MVRMDQFIDELLTSDYACNIALPHLPKRWVLEEANMLAPRTSLAEALDDDDEEEEEEEEEEEVVVEEEQKAPAPAATAATEPEKSKDGRNGTNGRAEDGEVDDHDSGHGAENGASEPPARMPKVGRFQKK